MSLSYIHRGSLAVVLLACACAGCVAPTGDEGVDRSRSDLLQPDLFTNDKAAYDYFRGKGLQNFQAAGIVGNLDQESGVDPLSVQAGGPGRGIAQWSVGGRWDTDANDNAQWYATQQGQSVDSLQLQLDFVWYELTTFSGYGLAALEASANVTDATVAFQNDFEGCGTCDQSTRISYAQGVLAAYGNDAVDGGGSLPDSGGGGTPCTVPGVGTGECITTTQCMSMPGYKSTPNYCPGPTNIQCCTGSPPPDSGSGSGSSSGGGSGSGSGSSSSSGAGSSSSGASGSGSGGSSSSSSGIGAGGDAGIESDGGIGGRGGEGGSAADTFPGYDPSKRCSAAPGTGTGGGSPALVMVGLTWLVARRRRKAS
jgi:MYXO-CTERM domain-containing protein